MSEHNICIKKNHNVLPIIGIWLIFCVLYYVRDNIETANFIYPANEVPINVI